MELIAWSEFLCVQIGTSSIEGYVDSIFIALCLKQGISYFLPGKREGEGGRETEIGR
jgi:hypothetical protein